MIKFRNFLKEWRESTAKREEFRGGSLFVKKEHRKESYRENPSQYGFFVEVISNSGSSHVSDFNHHEFRTRSLKETVDEVLKYYHTVLSDSANPKRVGNICIWKDVYDHKFGRYPLAWWSANQNAIQNNPFKKIIEKTIKNNEKQLS